MAEHGMGWVPDYPDIRDSTLSDDRVQNFSRKLKGVDKSDRIEDKIENLTRILSSLKETLSKDNQPVLMALSDEIEQESAAKINFFTAGIGGGTLAKGAEGEDIRDIQEKLAALGYFKLKDPLSGYFDSQVKESIQVFQRLNNFHVNGMISSMMKAELTGLAALAKEIEKRRYPFSNPLAFLPPNHSENSLNILFAQEALNFLGYYERIKDEDFIRTYPESYREGARSEVQALWKPGHFDKVTEHALRKFREDNRDCFGQEPTVYIHAPARKAIRKALTQKLLNSTSTSSKEQLVFVDLPLPAQILEKVTDQLLYMLSGLSDIDAIALSFGQDVDNVSNGSELEESPIYIKDSSKVDMFIDANFNRINRNNRKGFKPYLNYLRSYNKNLCKTSEADIDLKRRERELKTKIFKEYIAPIVETIIQLMIYKGQFKIELGKDYSVAETLKDVYHKKHLKDAFRMLQKLYMCRVIKGVSEFFSARNSSTNQSTVEPWEQNRQREYEPTPEQALEQEYKQVLEKLSSGQLVSSADSFVLQIDFDGLLFWLDEIGYVGNRPLRVTRSYSLDDTGSAIIHLQDCLRALGYYDAPTTGVFERLTREAVANFQSQRALVTGREITVDGMAGPQTMTELEELKRETFQPLNALLSPKILQGVLQHLGGIDKLCSDRIFVKNSDENLDKNLIQQTRDVVKPNLSQLRLELQNSKYVERAELDEQSETDAEIDLWIVNWLNRFGYSLVAPNGTTYTIKSVRDIKKILAASLSPVQSVKQQQEGQKAQVRAMLKSLILAQALSPITEVVAQLLAPIGRFDDLESAIDTEVQRFKFITQIAKFEEVVSCLKQKEPDNPEDVTAYLMRLENWQKRFQNFIFETRDKTTLDLLNDYKKYHEFKAFCYLAMNRLQEMEAIDVGVKEAIASEIYRGLRQDIYDFKAEEVSRKSEIFNDFIESLDGYLDEALKAQKEDKVILEQNRDGVKSVSKITCVRIGRQDSPGRQQTQGNLQVPVTGKLSQSITTALKQGNVYLVLPPFVDLSIWCSPIKNQGSLDACTAHAGVSLLEFFEKKSSGTYTNISRRFLYKATRNLMQRQGDTGASVRETMKAMVLFGVPPEDYCPYDEAAFDEDPSSFCYAFAQNYQAITYFRLDDANMSTDELLAQVKTVLVAGFPCMFGFTVYDSIHNSSNLPGHIPFPSHIDRPEGGHAVIAVGYDDYKQIKGASPGALLIKNSWGTDWGIDGYGWLPYDYVLRGLARDWWSLIKGEWVESGCFGLGLADGGLTNMGTPRRSNSKG